MMLGMLKAMAKGVPDDQLRNMCARVGVGMIAIYTGTDVQQALSLEGLTSVKMDDMIHRLEQMRDTNLELDDVEMPELVERSMPYHVFVPYGTNTWCGYGAEDGMPCGAEPDAEIHIIERPATYEIPLGRGSDDIPGWLDEHGYPIEHMKTAE